MSRNDNRINNPGPTARDLDFEKDSLHILPLSILPLQTPGLRESRMVKNTRLDSMIEVFRDQETGSGQVEPSRLARMYDWAEGARHPDGILIAKLSLMQSFDIYSLRIQLRSLGIAVENHDHLRLSKKRREELDRYLKKFTQPMYDMFQDDDGFDVIDLDDLTGSLNPAKRAAVLKNLKRLAQKLEILLPKLPAFLADVGDVFLSLAYFRDHFDRLLPGIEGFLETVEKLKDDRLCRTNPALRDCLERVGFDLAAIRSCIAERLRGFDEHTADMWRNASEDTFRRVKILIESDHAAIGGMLCGLQILVRGYEDRFAEGNRQSQELAEYVPAYVEPALNRIRLIERAARFAEFR
jgi:hypothetical protein